MKNLKVWQSIAFILQVICSGYDCLLQILYVPAVYYTLPLPIDYNGSFYYLCSRPSLYRYWSLWPFNVVLSYVNCLFQIRILQLFLFIILGHITRILRAPQDPLRTVKSPETSCSLLHTINLIKSLWRSLPTKKGRLKQLVTLCVHKAPCGEKILALRESKGGKCWTICAYGC